MRSLMGAATVAATILAMILQQILIIVAAGVLASGMILSWVIPFLRRRAARKKALESAQNPTERSLEDDGIIKIEPLPQSGDDASTEDKPATQWEPLDASSPDSDPSSSSAIPSSSSDPTYAPLPEVKEVLPPLLAGFRTLLAANAVCVVRQNDSSCRIIGASGSNFAKNIGETFDTAVHLLPAPRKLSIQIVQDELPSQLLGYSRIPGSLYRVALAPVGATPLILIADTTHQDGLTHPRIPQLFDQCAQLLGHLFYKENPTRSRRGIIAEEILIARTANRTLALALVLLRNSDPVSKMGEHVVAKAEGLLQERLQAVAPASHVVKFGKLVFGVFIDGRRSVVEKWAQDVHDALPDTDETILAGGVRIGIAILSEKHEGPLDFRKDAEDALLTAYTEDLRLSIIQ